MKLEIINSRTELFPFYQIIDEENEEICACDCLKKAKRIVKLFDMVNKLKRLLKS